MVLTAFRQARREVFPLLREQGWEARRNVFVRRVGDNWAAVEVDEESRSTYPEGFTSLFVVGAAGLRRLRQFGVLPWAEGEEPFSSQMWPSDGHPELLFEPATGLCRAVTSPSSVGEPEPLRDVVLRRAEWAVRHASDDTVVRDELLAAHDAAAGGYEDHHDLRRLAVLVRALGPADRLDGILAACTAAFERHLALLRADGVEDDPAVDDSDYGLRWSDEAFRRRLR